MTRPGRPQTPILARIRPRGGAIAVTAAWATLALAGAAGLCGCGGGGSVASAAATGGTSTSAPAGGSAGASGGATGAASGGAAGAASGGAAGAASTGAASGGAGGSARAVAYVAAAGTTSKAGTGGSSAPSSTSTSSTTASSSSTTTASTTAASRTSTSTAASSTGVSGASGPNGATGATGASGTTGAGGASGSGAPAGQPAASGGSASLAAAVTVSPLPGTPDAGDDTQISFLGVPASEISQVSVVGSRSGTHTGHLESYDSAPGASFVIDRRFTAGETVTAHARISSGSSATTVSTSFTIAHPFAVAQKGFPITPGTSAQEQHYLSEPTYTPSLVTVKTSPQTGAAAGDFFLAPYQGPGTPGPMILDGQGGLVWFHPIPPGDAATDFKIVQYEGKPTLAWWQGRILSAGFGQGEDFLYNSSYQRVAEIQAGNSMHADLHELRVTPQGSAWIDAFEPISMNLAPYGGLAGGVIDDSVIQEIDIKTGLVMYEWHALNHISPADSYSAPPKTVAPWDYVHVNSISLAGPAGTLLLSSRNTWTIFEVNIHGGKILWRIGGKHSDFKLGPGVQFYWQHDAEWQPGGLLSVFDNGASPAEEKESRGLVLRVDSAGHTVSLVKQFVNSDETLLTSSQGDTQSLPGGDWLMGYGGLPNFTEYNSSGKILFDATLATGDQSFRTYLLTWSGQPTTRPAVAAQAASGGAVNVQASWNGATTVARWRVLAGASSSALTPAATADRSGFETTIAVRSAGPYFAVQALGSSGQVLATSLPVHV